MKVYTKEGRIVGTATDITFTFDKNFGDSKQTAIEIINRRRVFYADDSQISKDHLMNILALRNVVHERERIARKKSSD